MNDYLEFEIMRSANAGQPYYFRIKAKPNGRVLAHSETYVNKSDCIAAVKRIKSHAATAAIWDMSVKPLALVS